MPSPRNPPKTEYTISEKSSIQVGLLASILVVAVTGTFYWSRWMSRVETTVETMQRDISGIKSSIDSLRDGEWQYLDMRRWSTRLMEANPDLKVPTPLGDSK